MIVRLVSLKVPPERANEFRAYFETLYERIRTQRGCLSLRLVADEGGDGQFFTISEWEGPDALEAYRKSAFFRESWPRVKSFLHERPWAQSFHILLDGQERPPPVEPSAAF